MADGQNVKLLIDAFKVIREWGPVVYPVLRQLIFVIREVDGINNDEENELLGLLASDPAMIGMKDRLKRK